MPYDEMLNLGATKVTLILNEHGFHKDSTLTRIDDIEQNIVEFVQNLFIEDDNAEPSIQFKTLSDIEPSGEDSYH